MEIEIPIRAISGNHRNLMRNGRFFPSKEYKEFKSFIYWWFLNDKIKWSYEDALKDNLSVEFTFGFKDKRRRDISNCIKTIEDACNGLLWKDDSQITELHASKVHSENDFIKIKILL